MRRRNIRRWWNEGDNSLMVLRTATALTLISAYLYGTVS